MSEVAVSEKEQIDFNTKYTALYLLDTLGTYMGVLQGVYSEQNNNHAKNKCAEVEKASEKAVTAIRKDTMKFFNDEEKAFAEQYAEDCKNLIYSVFGLEPQERFRVQQLIKKLKKEN